VAREYIDRCGGVFPALAELLDQMEIAAGIEDALSVIAFIEIASGVLGTRQVCNDRQGRNKMETGLLAGPS
jgi:hypothetical protein